MPRTARKRQTRLSFDPLPTSSPAPGAAGLSPSVRDRAAAVRHDGNPAKRRKVRDAPGASLTSRLASGARVNKESLPPTPDPTNHTSFGASVVSDDSGDDLPPTRRLSGRKNQTKEKELGLTPVSPQAINSSRPVKAGFFGTQQPKQRTLDSSDSDSLPDLSVVKSKKKKKKDKQKKKEKRRSQPSPSQEQERDQPTEEVANLEDDSDLDEMPTTPAVKRQASKRKRQASSSPLPDPDDSDDSDDVVITGSRKRSLSAKKVAPQPSESEQAESEQEESEDEPPSRSRKRLRRGDNKSSQMSTITEEERQDLEDDLMDLASSGSDAEVRLRKKNKTTKRSAREEALEQLKRRRGGTATIEEEEEEEEEEEDELLGQPDDGEDDYPSGSEEEDDLPLPRTTRVQMFSKDEDDEGFVIDDDDGPLGGPSSMRNGVPIEFTHYASMKAKDLFKFAIEWMVQKKINPAFQIDDEIYILTFKKLDDEVKGLAGSKFKSAAWTAKFALALEARPDIIYVPLDRHAGDNFLRDKCDACNRSGHPATYEVYFQGKPYNKETLEPVGPTKESGAGLDSDDDDSESDSSVSENAAAVYNYDSAGRRILPEDTKFYLGKFCMSNAQTAHSLQHWRYHLYEWVVEYLESAGWSSPEMIVKRDKWSTRKRRKHADKVVDLMEQGGKIKALYKDFRLEIDTARNAKQGRWDSSP